MVVSYCHMKRSEPGRKRCMQHNFFYFAYADRMGIIGLMQYTFA